jgi:hypothetical protein
MSRAEKKKLTAIESRECQSCSAFLGVALIPFYEWVLSGAGLGVAFFSQDQIAAGVVAIVVVFGLMFRLWVRMPLGNRSAGWFGPPAKSAEIADADIEGLNCPSCRQLAMPYAAKFRLGPAAKRPCQHCGVNLSVPWVSMLFFVPPVLAWIALRVFGYTVATVLGAVIAIYISVLLPRKYWIRLPLVRR